MKNRISRREFLKIATVSSSVIALTACAPSQTPGAGAVSYDYLQRTAVLLYSGG